MPTTGCPVDSAPMGTHGADGIAVVGAGAAGLMAAIWAGRTARAGGGSARIVALDGARSLGAKILVAGGGRCNVTHHEVSERDYAGSTAAAIKKVLRRYTVAQTVEFFGELGVELKREETGKLFPTTDKARTVLDALLRAASNVGVETMHPWRVESVEREEGGFVIRSSEPGWAAIRAKRVILATGGKSLPKTGSDGHGYAIVKSLGHTVTERILPALVPLILAEGHFVRGLSGLTLPTTLELRSATGKRLVSFTNSTLCTHFGLSGPSVLDISRFYLDRVGDEPGAGLFVNWLPGESFETVDAALQGLGKATPGSWLRKCVPERLALALCAEAGVDPTTPGASLGREPRRALARMIVETRLPVTGSRGFGHAEVTAGGVPLSEVNLETMESRVCPGLHLVGEICDVDGRIGGFNFQWAWASGYVAGIAAGTGCE